MREVGRIYSKTRRTRKRIVWYFMRDEKQIRSQLIIYSCWFCFVCLWLINKYNDSNRHSIRASLWEGQAFAKKKFLLACVAYK